MYHWLLRIVLLLHWGGLVLVLVLLVLLLLLLLLLLVGWRCLRCGLQLLNL